MRNLKPLLLVPAVVVLVTCLPPAGGGGGGLLHDAGVFLMDAGRAMGGDARAQDPPREVSEVRHFVAGCDRETTWTSEYVENPDQINLTHSTRYYTDLEIEDLTPGSSLVTVYGCDRETFGDGTRGRCSPGYRCEDDDPGQLDCTTLSYAHVAAGRLRVWCGNRYDQTYGQREGERTEQLGGERFRTVRVAVL